MKKILSTTPVVVAALIGLAGTTRVRAGEPAAKTEEPTVSVTPIVRYVDVDGDSHRFQQDWWMKDHWAGGLDNLTVDRKLGEKGTLTFEGRAIYNEHDYKLSLEIINPDIGFVRAGYTEFRKYYDDTGGFFDFAAGPDSFSLGQDLHLDISDLFVEAGLTLPNWPRLVLGYERKSKDGTKSMIEWGTASLGAVSRNINPASKQIDDDVDIFKVEIDHDINNVHIGDQFRYERYDFSAIREDDTTRIVTNAAPGKSVTVHESYNHDAFFNTFHIDSHVNDLVYWSAGYLFSTLNGEPGLAVDTTIDPAFGGTSSGTDKFWMINKASIDQNSHVLNLNAMFGPFFKKSMYFYGGIQAEKTQTDGFTDADLTETGSPNEAAIINTHNDKDWYQERIGVRFIGIPFTTVYAEGKFDQGNVALFEEEVTSGLSDPTLTSETTDRYTDADIQRQDYRIGFNTAPINRVTFSGYYRYNQRKNDYNNLIDQLIELGTNGVADVTHQEGYSAFIDHQKFTTDEIGAKLTLRPASKLAVSLKYQLVSTKIDTRFEDPASDNTSGYYDANIYTASATILPISRMYVTALVSYQDTRTNGRDNGSTSIATYRGDVISALGAIGYALDDKTDLRAEYTASFAHNIQNNAAAGLPLGTDYNRHGVQVSLSRRLCENVIARLGYGFFKYNDDATGGVNDYTAHLANASCTVRF